MLDNTEFQEQAVAEMLFIVVYSSNEGSPNKYVCKILKCIFMRMNKISQNKFLVYR
jgi:hypothetical protein